MGGDEPKIRHWISHDLGQKNCELTKFDRSSLEDTKLSTKSASIASGPARII